MSYDAFEDPACYPGSFVLKNSADIREQDQLDAFELEMVELSRQEGFPTGNFDPAHYCAIHRQLFGAVYDWAGQHRTVRTAKGGDMFCYPEFIADQMETLFARLRGPAFDVGVERNVFVRAAADFLAELNAIHPFREGNGRTQLTFLFLLGVRAGHHFDMTRIRPQGMLAAMVASFHGRVGALEGEIERLLV